MAWAIGKCIRLKTNCVCYRINVQDAENIDTVTKCGSKHGLHQVGMVSSSVPISVKALEAALLTSSFTVSSILAFSNPFFHTCQRFKVVPAVSTLKYNSSDTVAPAGSLG